MSKIILKYLSSWTHWI